MIGLVHEIKTRLKTLEIPYTMRGRATEYLAAEAVAMNLELPSSKIRGTNEFFVTHHKTKVLLNLSDINEHVVIDIERTADLVYQIWRIRYCLVYEPRDPSVGRIVSHAVACDKSKIPGGYIEMFENHPDLMKGPWLGSEKNLEDDNG